MSDPLVSPPAPWPTKPQTNSIIQTNPFTQMSQLVSCIHPHDVSIYFNPTRQKQWLSMHKRSQYMVAQECKWSGGALVSLAGKLSPILSLSLCVCVCVCMWITYLCAQPCNESEFFSLVFLQLLLWVNFTHLYSAGKIHRPLCQNTKAPHTYKHTHTPPHTHFMVRKQILL